MNINGKEMSEPAVKRGRPHVKRGHWYQNKSKYVSELGAYFIQACCSCCGRYSDRIDIYTTTMTNEFCSHCGARMIKDGVFE